MSSNGRVVLLLAACLLVAFASPAMADDGGMMSRSAELVDILGLFLVGLLLILLEIFIVPGHGFVGLPGLALLGWSLYICVERFGMNTGLTLAAVLLALAAVLTYFILKIFPHTPAGRALFHQKNLEAVAAPESHSMKASEWVGLRGVAVSELRPAGSARVSDRTLDVVCEDGYLEKGTRVEIVAFDEGRILVRRVDES
jgi:membrane-bound serine protease (ClpP class)